MKINSFHCEIKPISKYQQRNLFLIVLVFLNVSFSAQTHRFIYEYQFKTDTTAEKYEIANMILDINPENVKFYDYEYAKNDSLNKLHDSKNYIWNEDRQLLEKETLMKI